MSKAYIDTETCGLHGVPVTIQWAIDKDKPQIWDIWKNPAGETLELIEELMNHTFVGFNVPFDAFHLYKIWTMLSLWDRRDELPEDHIDDLAEVENEANLHPYVIRPQSVLDLLLHARKGPYQSLMDRKDIRIRKIPAVLSDALAEELGKRVELSQIYFSRKKDKHAPHWNVYDIEGNFDFKDVVLKFAASSALKVLVEHALGIEPDAILKFTDIHCHAYPMELGYAPKAMALSNRAKKWMVKMGDKTGFAWPGLVHRHISHWANNSLARKYAADDVKYLPMIEDHFGNPTPGDDDSELAWMVAVCRWRGYAVDIEAIKGLRETAISKIGKVPLAPKQALAYIGEKLDPIERSQFKSTAKAFLEKNVKELKCDCKMKDTDLSDIGFGFEGFEFMQQEKDTTCERCGGTGVHPAVERINEILSARKAIKERELYDKFIIAGRFHASFKVIGTLSSRMAGADGLNPQGINRSKAVRKCFPLADNGLILCGGDFDSFEVVLADAAYNDPNLREQLQSKKPCHKCKAKGKRKNKETGEVVDCDECKGTGETGVKIHALFGMELWPGMTYEEVLADLDKYTIAKSAVFAMIYGGDWNTLVIKYNIDPDQAQKAEQNFMTRFPGVKRAREKVTKMFAPMQQPGGPGTKVIWNEPHEYIESLMGFRRYFTLENRICKQLFKLAQRPPKGWKEMKIKCVRRDKVQTVGGALMSALYGSSFNIQSANCRAANNHVIQSSGATITKRVQRNVWDIQPCGVHRWLVQPMNIHDELMVPCDESVIGKVQETVYGTIESFRDRVPLISMEWATHAKNWAEAK